MSKLKELIDKYCPNGVEYKPLGDVSEFRTGWGFPESEQGKTEGKYPFYKVGDMNNSAVFMDIANNYISEETSIKLRCKPAPRGTIIFPKIGATMGTNKKRILTKDSCYDNNVMGIIAKSDIINDKFLYYYFSGFKLMDFAKGTGAVPSLDTNKLKKLQTPIPPIEVQEEIVKILDRFAVYTAELQAELQARKEQYEYYRNLLLNFNHAYGAADEQQKKSVTTWGGHSYEIQWKSLGDIGKFYGGLTGKSKTDFDNGNAKYVTYMNVFNNLAIRTDIKDKVKISINENQNKIEYGDAIFTGSSETPDECGMSSVLTKKIEEPIYLNSFCFGLRFNDKTIFNPEFLKHLLRSKLLREQIKKTANGVTRFNVSKKLFAKIEIPIPPLELQERIVAILDKFETLVNDLSQGLPAEIAAVQEQYEYYRNKLLTFKQVA